MIRILFFGPVAEQIGARELQLESATVKILQDVVTYIQTHHAQAYALVSFIAVNNVQTRDMQLSIKDNDEIALMAKFSGG